MVGGQTVTVFPLTIVGYVGVSVVVGVVVDISVGIGVGVVVGVGVGKLANLLCRL